MSLTQKDLQGLPKGPGARLITEVNAALAAAGGDFDGAALFDSADDLDEAVQALAAGVGVKGLVGVHKVRGMVLANIADLAAFTVASNDGLTYAAGERVYLGAQTTGAENGIYVVGTVATGTAPLTRAPDWAAAAVIPTGTLIVVDAGTIGFDAIWMVNNTGNVTVATTTPTLFPVLNNGVQALTGAGAVNLTTAVTRVTSSGAAQALTLADGAVVGQRKRIVHAVDGGSCVLTAGGALHLGDSIASITLTAKGDWVELMWNGTAWDLIGHTGATIA